METVPDFNVHKSLLQALLITGGLAALKQASKTHLCTPPTVIHDEPLSQTAAKQTSPHLTFCCITVGVKVFIAVGDNLISGVGVKVFAGTEGV
jgi:hypothetical protein